MKKIFILFIGLLSFQTWAQDGTNKNPFRQLGQELPTPNVYRAASGAPGHDYWQQQADYNMKIRIDDEEQKLYGDETVTYINNSPDELRYIWLQLDQNVRAKDSDSPLIREKNFSENTTIEQLMRSEPWFDGGFKIDHVKSGGKDLEYTINKTMMRIELPKVLQPGAKFIFNIKWWYNINDRSKMGGRSGLEYFEEEDNYLYTIAQFFPRMVMYADNTGWQNKQFLGSGEFTLTFGNYKVEITVPSDHIVGSTGVLQNSKTVLTRTQIKRLEESRTADEPVMIVTQEEAEENEKTKAKGEKTWIFEAENVRDFAFCSSRKFIWDAMGVQCGKNKSLAMSYYPKEGNPLWEKYSTKAVAHTLEVYSKFTIDYPYPVAISVHTDRIGMEYPMICFNGGRPEADGTYSERTKYGMISVIIHEVGHNFFPMIINSDERQWTWMDEGLNTFVQYLTEKEWDRDYPTRRGPARNIVGYMGGDKENIAPIMTNSESLIQFGNNAYGKPATALNILRETVMGRELFDYAFKEYSRRWAFKHPRPADFFRTMEDASAVDLDWFWRGWFYTTDNVDIALNDVQWIEVGLPDVEKEKAEDRKREEEEAMDISLERDKTAIPETLLEGDPKLRDFYTERDVFTADELELSENEELLANLTAEQKEWLEGGKNVYNLTLENIGGIVMPVIVMLEFADGTNEIIRIPAEIWKKGKPVVKTAFITDKPVIQLSIDPYLETADVDINNNYWPPRQMPTRFDLFKEQKEKNQTRENPMQRQQRIEELKKTK